MIDFLLALVFGAVAVAAGPVLGARAKAPSGQIAVVAATLLPAASIGLFYSLAIHMHDRLGGWPEMIGDQGFPRGLVLHAVLAQFAFGSMILGGILACPVAALACLGVPRMRPGLRYVGIYALASGAAYAGMMLAPDPFLYWWWD